LNVKINASGLKDEPLKKKFLSEAEFLKQKTTDREKVILDLVESKIN